MTALVELQGVHRTFGEGAAAVSAVAGIDLSIAEGELVAIVGPSGAGKSTLLQLMGGLDRPTAGRVLVEGSDLACLSDRELTLFRRRRMGFVFQFFNLLPLFTALENAALPLSLDGVPRVAAEARARELLERVGLTSRQDHLPDQLSGGERQRLAIARALAASPPLVLADEPTGNLDRARGNEILTLLQSLVQEAGVTIVVVTHDAEAANRASRVVEIVDGRVVRDEARH